jgi:predicted phosphodiesterase
MNTTFKWRPEEEHLLRILLPTNSQREIAEQINRRHDQGLPGFPCERTEEAIRKKISREALNPVTFKEYRTINPLTERARKIAAIQKEYEDESEDYNVGRPTSAGVKILTLSDIHFPYARVDYLMEAVKAHEDADICVLNGDIFEGHVFSTFEKHKRIAALHEYQAAFEFVNLCAELFPKVYLIAGNHDVRSAKALAREGFEQEASQIFRPDLLARLANGEMLDETGLLVDRKDFSNVFYDQRESWYLRIGRTIFAHPHGRGGGKPGATVQTVANYFNSRYQHGAIDCVVIGHVHKFYKGIHAQQLLIEQGCLSGLMTYAHSPKLEFFGGAVNGYAVVYQDEEGNCDFNKSGPVYLGYVMPPKKSVI